MIFKTPDQIQSLLCSREVVLSAFSSAAGQGCLRALEQSAPGFREALQAIMDAVDQVIENGSTNSANSSLPPSLDPGPVRKSEEPRKRSPRKADSKRKPGGQPGHPGTTLLFTDHPDEIRDIYPEGMSGNGTVVDHVLRYQKYEYRIERKVVEYRYHVLRDMATGKLLEPPIPKGVRPGCAQYDASLKAAAVELNVFHMVPYARVCQHFAQDGFALSEGSIYNFIHQLATGLRRWGFEDWLADRLLGSDFINTDETPVTFDKKKAYVHICRSDKIVWFFFHRSRGHEAHEAMGILPVYTGILVVDCFPGYDRYDCRRAYCHAHLIRELRGVLEREGYRWAQLFLDFFAHYHDLVAQKGALSEEELKRAERHYRSLITRAWNSMDIPLPPGPLRESRKNSKSVNLLIRLEVRMPGWLLWAKVGNIPYTNNDSERPLRMIKVREKVSNCFRSEVAAQDWCLVRSYIVTCQLHGLTNVRKQLENLFRGILPEFMTSSGSSQQPYRRSSPLPPAPPALPQQSSAG